jgi:hypothetical protein
VGITGLNPPWILRSTNAGTARMGQISIANQAADVMQGSSPASPLFNDVVFSVRLRIQAKKSKAT